METLALMVLVMAVITPILCIASFIVGYNVNAQRKILKLPEKKREPTADEVMLERIENAKVYKTEK